MKKSLSPSGVILAKKVVYVYVLSDKTDDVVLPAAINLKNIVLNKNSSIIYMDAPGEKIKVTSADGATVINIPAKLQNKVAGKYAVSFKILL